MDSLSAYEPLDEWTDENSIHRKARNICWTTFNQNSLINKCYTYKVFLRYVCTYDDVNHFYEKSRNHIRA